MNLIFSEGTRAHPVRRFEVPDQLDFCSRTKRGRRDDTDEKMGEEGVFTHVTTPPSQATQASVLAFIQRYIEHGKGYVSEEETLQNGNGSNDHGRLVSLLHLALSILCHVAALDESGHFISTSSNLRCESSNISEGNNNERGEKGNHCVAKDGQSRAFSLRDIYTTIRALKLEYEDVLQQQKGGSGKQKANAQSVAASITTTETRINASLALLEQTIVQLFLNFDRARKIPINYVSNILQAIPQVFTVVKWPLTILQKEKDAELKKRRYCDDGELCDDVSNAATAIVMKALQTLKKEDCLRVLRFHTNTDNRPLSDNLMLISLEGMMRKTLNGAYRRRGLYGALHDMRLLIYRLYATVPSEQELIVTAARQRFEELIRLHYLKFIHKTGLYNLLEGPLLPEKTIFDVNPLPTENDAALYTDTQRRCLQLLDLLRKADPKGWFEHPVFDMANIELSSVERWVRGLSFGTKTNRDAFVALRDVLEQMVNNCVMSYGPTSQYSQVITLVRQRLVDAAREVGLI